MANYNRTKLRSIDNTIANQYLVEGVNSGSTAMLAITFSFRGRNRLSPIGDLENNHQIYIDTTDPGVGYSVDGGQTPQLIYPYANTYIALNSTIAVEVLLNASEIKIYCRETRKFATNITVNSSTEIGFDAPAYSGAPGAVTLVLCTPYGWANFPFEYQNGAP
jgi:hypothetical protein